MTLPLWGLLQKSTDDSETIEQAIARLIAVHEESPTSHLGEGESLSAHKHDTIIDHPAQSIVLDKKPYMYYEQYLSGLGEQGWSNEDGAWGTNSDTIKSASLFSQTSFIGIGALQNAVGSSYPTQDLMYQFRLSVAHGGNTDGNLRFGFTNDVLDSGSRMVIVKDGLAWKWQIYSASGLVHSYTISSVNTLTKYYRIWFDSVNEKIVLYEGTTVISEYATANWKNYIFIYIGVDMNRTTNTQMSFDLRGWKSTFSLNIDI